MSAGRPVVLVVDDEEGPRQAIRMVFKDEYHVVLADGGLAALSYAAEHLVHVAIVDIMMPGLSGIEVLEELKRIDPKIEVIILTAYETLATARQALRLGACDYLNKPFDVGGMRTTVTRALEKNRAAHDRETAYNRLRELESRMEEQEAREEMFRTRGDIYASVLHDLNGPLTVISAFVRGIKKRLESEAHLEGSKLEGLRGDLGRLAGEVERCFEISRRYLSFLQPCNSCSKRVEVNQVLNDLKALLAYHPDAKGKELAVGEPPGSLVADMDGTDLLQILLNLSINALQCRDGTLRVEVAAEDVADPAPIRNLRDEPGTRFLGFGNGSGNGKLIALTVKDNGPGMPPEILRCLFESQFTTKPEGKGTGLGLTIVRRLIERAGGALHVESAPGKGSVFRIYVPAR